MNVSALSGTTATVAQPTVTTAEVRASQTNPPEARLTVLPSGDTVRISAEARSLSAQMPPVTPTPTTAVARSSSRSTSADNPTQASTSSLRLVTRDQTSTEESSAVFSENAAMLQEDTIAAVEANSATSAQQQTEQAADQEDSTVQQQEQQAEEDAQTAEEENKNDTQIREVESEITGVRRDITFLVGRAAINETVREELHEKKTELSELMVELFQLESVSGNSLR